jgi:hypothetical protein
MYEHVLSDITKMRGKLNNEIDKVEVTAKAEMEHLKKAYPMGGKFGIPGSEVT